MNELRKNLERISGKKFKELQRKADIFIQMMNNLDNKKKSLIKNQFHHSLMWNKLTIEKVKDSFFLKEILHFFKDIKQLNFDNFKGNFSEKKTNWINFCNY